MVYTFNLKNPKSDKASLILFSAYFKLEKKKFIYSTGETILPKEWDFKNKMPAKINGRGALAERHRSIKMQLDRYSNYFIELTNRMKNIGQPITIMVVREQFDKKFKKSKNTSSSLIEIYDKFLTFKKNDKSSKRNSASTIKRYDYFKTLLLEFEKCKKVKLNLHSLDLNVYNALLDFFIKVKQHKANTLRRNVGLFITFLNWALENEYTFNTKFKKFTTPAGQETDEIALTMDQVKAVYNFDLSEHPRYERVRDIFILGCVTGLRISNYSKIKREDIVNGIIKVVDVKDKSKTLKIPLNDYSKAILEKYDYVLPMISTQKFNKYIKEAFELMGYDWKEKKIYRIGNEVKEVDVFFNDLISSHTARRSFITIMKNKKIPDKVIMDYTGHKSLEVFNKYYKPNVEDKKEFMNQVWSLKS